MALYKSQKKAVISSVDKKSGFQKRDMVQYLLAGFIVFSLTGSVVLDFYRQKEAEFLDLRKELSFVDLLGLEDSRQPLSDPKIRQYLKYFQQAYSRDHSSGDSRALAGFCYYHLGQKDKARSVYQEVLNLYPNFFAFVYNVAVLDFEEGRYEEALEGFKKALAVNPAQTIGYLRGFKNFIYMIYRMRVFDFSLNERLKEGYALSAYFAAVCCEKLENKKQAVFFHQQSLNIKDVTKTQKPRLRIF